MKSIRIISTILLLVLTGCGGNRHTDVTEEKLNSYSTVTDYFTREEIKDLAKLLDFFNEQICITRGIDKKKIIECYDSFIERIFEMANEGIIDFKIPFEEQQEIYNQISDSLFHQIWGFDIGWKRNSRDTLKHLTYNRNGKYMKFLNKLGKEYDMIKICCEDFRLAGGVSPTWVGEIIMIKEKYNYDLNDMRLQLFVAINYLTWNDGLLRNKEYFDQLIKTRIESKL